MDLYDYKPQLAERFGEEVSKSVYPDDLKTTMSNAQLLPRRSFDLQI